MASGSRFTARSITTSKAQPTARTANPASSAQPSARTATPAPAVAATSACSPERNRHDSRAGQAVHPRGECDSGRARGQDEEDRRVS
jgi:hypothetical protein